MHSHLELFSKRTFNIIFFPLFSLVFRFIDRSLHFKKINSFIKFDQVRIVSCFFFFFLILTLGSECVWRTEEGNVRVGRSRFGRNPRNQYRSARVKVQISKNVLSQVPDKEKCDERRSSRWRKILLMDSLEKRLKEEEKKHELCIWTVGRLCTVLSHLIHFDLPQNQFDFFFFFFCNRGLRILRY